MIQYKFAQTAAIPAPVTCWWLAETKKRNLELENEIDFNEIEQALRGVKNKWFVRVSDQREKFALYSEKKGMTWVDIANL